MIELNLCNEVSELESVVLGTAFDFGGEPRLDSCYDPKSRYHVVQGTFPKERHLKKEINALIKKYRF